MTERKARLKALSRKAGRNENEPSESQNEEGSKSLKDDSKKALKFRNYSLTESAADGEEGGRQSKRPKVEEGKPAESTENQKSVLEIAAEKARRDVLSDILRTQSGDPNAVNALAPKKINWDLKEGIESKLAKLEKRTQRALVQLLRERLEKEAETTD